MSIFLDFDGTITTKDTVTELANFALRFQAERNATSSPGTSGRSQDATAAPPEAAAVQEREGQEEDLSSRWDGVVRAYMSDHEAHASSYAPGAADRRRVEDEVAFLRSQKHVEMRSLGRVNACGLFRGIGPAAFRAAGRALVQRGGGSGGAVRLRPGFAGLVRAARARGWRVHVVSVNWSAAFIEGACGLSEEDDDEEGEGIHVIANEVREHDGAVVGPGALAGDGRLLAGGADGGSRGYAGRNLTNSCDKRDAVREVLRRRGAGEGGPVVYFGDSTTDMECLLEATRGVVVADDESSALIETLRRLGKRVPHVRDAEAGEELVWASNFDEVMRFTFDP
ncbi:putative upf0655 protein ycr015c protein [Rosellinia necatrix]|uniref:Putative upf0655 protein ycr015c protein n=1 Tax=Rosellinia necatrix TaxID=77044 RepID=A0A1W2TE73_ROSNE|nr:putative upf0655 protein ycr015c protein [Rosellinia necatrix]